MQRSYEMHAANDATLMIAEFNEAMRVSVNTATRSSLRTATRKFSARFEHLDFVHWDNSQRAWEMCVAYKEAHFDSDLTQCIVPNRWVDIMDAAGGGTDFWGPNSIGAAARGVSWMVERCLPGEDWEKDHISLHEFGHNFGAIHLTNQAFRSVMSEEVGPKEPRFVEENAVRIRETFHWPAHFKSASSLAEVQPAQTAPMLNSSLFVYGFAFVGVAALLLYVARCLAKNNQEVEHTPLKNLDEL